MNFKELRQSTGLTLKQFGEVYGIPYRTVQDWEYEKRKAPEWVFELIKYKIENEKAKEKLIKMFEEKQTELVQGATPQKALMLNAEIILLREIIGDKILE